MLTFFHVFVRIHEPDVIKGDRVMYVMQPIIHVRTGRYLVVGEVVGDRAVHH